MKRLVIVSTFAFISAAAFSSDKAGLELKPAIVWSGTDSSITEEDTVRCVSEAEFRELWTKHRMDEGKRQSAILPDVDFESYMVVGVFVGKRGYVGIKVESVSDEGDAIRVRFKVMSQQMANVNPNAINPSPGPPVRGYCFAILARSDKAIVVEEGSRLMLNQPLEWKERTKLPAVR